MDRLQMIPFRFRQHSWTAAVHEIYHFIGYTIATLIPKGETTRQGIMNDIKRRAMDISIQTDKEKMLGQLRPFLTE